MSTDVPISTGEEVEAAAPNVEPSSEAPISQEQEKVVPLAALEAERSQRQKLADELSMVKEHLNLLNARQQQAPQPQEGPAADDVMTHGEFNQKASVLEKQFRASLAELQMSKDHPDYDEVIRKYLPDIIKQDPSVGEFLQQTQNSKLAYSLAKSTDAYRRDHQEKKKNEDAERLIANSERPGSLSAVGGTTPISVAKRYRDMSDEEFRKEMAKNVGYA